MSTQHLWTVTVGLLAVAVSACTAVVQPDSATASTPATLTRVLAAGPATYVLSQVEKQTGDELVTFDHICQGARFRTTVRDTITFSADGSVRRAFLLARTIGDTNSSQNYLATNGRWNVVPARFGLTGTHLALTSTLPNGVTLPSYEVELRDADTVVMLSGLGGSCPGSPNDGREAAFVYTRR